MSNISAKHETEAESKIKHIFCFDIQQDFYQENTYTDHYPDFYKHFSNYLKYRNLHIKN